MNNVTQVIDKKMCIGCGACTSICPTSCIEFLEGQYNNYIKVDESKCVNCSMCMKVCPGEKNAKRLVEGAKVDIESNIKEIKVSYSTNEELRKKSASGGVITQMLKSMFEMSEIDAAVVVTQNMDNVLLNKVQIVTNVEELMNSQGSRYSPSGNCVAIKDIIKSDYKKVAFVGKPCDIEALSSYEELNKKLKEKIVMKISIMCHHSPTRKGLLNLLEAKEINPLDIKNMSFRGDGWPGSFKIEKKNGEVIATSYFDAWNNYLCNDHNEKCNYCDNPFPLEADVIVGDPWGEEYKNDKLGQSLIIIRSDRAVKIIKDLEKEQVIKSQDSTYEDVKRYQKFLLERHNQFKLLSLVYKDVHNHKNRVKDYTELFKEDPKDLLRFIKRRARYKKAFDEWQYK